MKELSIEQKSKRYDEVIEKFDVILNLNTVKESGTIFVNDVRKILHELKEDEDERIRKWIRKELESKYVVDNTVNNVLADKALAWLEKQGKSNMGISEATKQELENNLNKALEKETPESCNKFLDEQGGLDKDSEGERIRKWLIELVEEVRKANPTNVEYNGMCSEAIVWLEKQREQKSTDKVEPKFKVGDWIVYNDNLYHIGNIALQRYYECLRVDGTVHTFSFDIDNKSHLWTIIQDAKDGDVLTGHETIVIFKKIDGLNIKCYCTYHFMNFTSFYLDTLQSKDSYTPATKGQRDLLFQRIHDAGYEWDADKKELKKIEQKPAWSEEDLDSITAAINNLEYFKNNCVYHLIGLEPAITFLKSLKDRYTWKPSEEQMHYLHWIANVKLGDSVVEQEVSKHLNELYEDLKKLREE